MNNPTRRTLLGAALATVATAGVPASAQAAADVPALSSWKLRWSPSAATDRLAAFETVEDDRADSHVPGQPHIFTQGDNYRWNMHMADRDSSTDRQRQEVTGMRSPAGGRYLEWKQGETWRTTYSLYIPSSLKATTTFTHIMQMKQPGNGTSPIVVQSLRRVNGAQTIELALPIAGVLIGRTSLDPLHDKWIDVDFRIRIGNGSAGMVRWILRSAGSTVVDVTKNGVDTFLEDRVRPKWGIYRSLGDTSGSLRDTYMLTSAMRGYQLVSETGGRSVARAAAPR
nr:polysaccharide lyase [Streptomyces sp. NBC_00974]